MRQPHNVVRRRRLYIIAAVSLGLVALFAYFRSCPDPGLGGHAGDAALHALEKRYGSDFRSALTGAGCADMDEVGRLRAQVQQLERQLQGVRAEAAAPVRDTMAMARHQRIFKQVFEFLSVENLMELARANRDKYRRAQPFPHIALDDFWPAEFVQAVDEEVLDNTDPSAGGVSWAEVCKMNADEVKLKQTSKLSLDPFAYRPNCYHFIDDESPHQNQKVAITNEEAMGPYTRLMFFAKKSPVFLRFLEALTGIAPIIPDPEFRGSGVHLNMAGGHLSVHADFNKYKRYSLERRVNVFTMLNKDWEEEWGGHLELWDRTMTRCVQRIAPHLNRFVVFSSTDFSYHGHPATLKCPPNRSRRSMALYYYTNGARPSNEIDHHSGSYHSTLWQSMQGGCLTCHMCRAMSPMHLR